VDMSALDQDPAEVLRTLPAHASIMRRRRRLADRRRQPGVRAQVLCVLEPMVCTSSPTYKRSSVFIVCHQHRYWRRTSFTSRPPLLFCFSCFDEPDCRRQQRISISIESIALALKNRKIG
jgi:hypothetical protein